jgi:hypothetical protein
MRRQSVIWMSMAVAAEGQGKGSHGAALVFTALEFDGFVWLIFVFRLCVKF